MNELEAALILIVETLQEMQQSQRRRLLIVDSQIEALNKLADRLEVLEGDFINLMVDLQAICKICGRLNLLCARGDNEQTIEEDLSDWH